MGLLLLLLALFTLQRGGEDDSWTGSVGDRGDGCFFRAGKAPKLPTPPLTSRISNGGSNGPLGSISSPSRFVNAAADAVAAAAVAAAVAVPVVVVVVAAAAA